MIKKTYIALLLSSVVAVSSCDMDIPQQGVVTIENAIETKADCEKFMNNIYSDLRAATAGSYMADTELQMDMFVGTVNNGNRGMQFSSGGIFSTNSDVESIWAGMYGGINNCNFLIEAAQKLIDEGKYTGKDAETINQYIGCAKFARAYYYFYLMDHFCKTYTAASASQAATGVPIVLDYNPTADRSKYPGRSTQQETVNQINQDLAEAYTALKAYEADVTMENVTPCAPYINSYAVTALQARVALATGAYATALSKAEEVISSELFALADITSYPAMWTNDEATELIFVPFGNLTERSSVPATGSIWLTNDKKNTSDFIPVPDVYTMYQTGDVRRTSFITIYTFAFEGTQAQGLAFNKYPGNTIFNQGNENPMRNKPKPFRTSELYLIAAEAAAATNQADKANDYLNELRENRIANYTAAEYSGANLVNEIRIERNRELIGEGFRMSDLRRWGQGFTRTCNYTSLGLTSTLNSFIQPNSLGVTYLGTDHRYVWPIPQAEMDVNPQLAGQQNPGY